MKFHHNGNIIACTLELCLIVLQKLTADYYDDYNADIWAMSPPCQPFTKHVLLC